MLSLRKFIFAKGDMVLIIPILVFIFIQLPSLIDASITKISQGKYLKDSLIFDANQIQWQLEFEAQFCRMGFQQHYLEQVGLISKGRLLS